MVTVYCGSIRRLGEEQKNTVLSTLSPEALARLNAKHHEHLYTSSLFALSLLTDEQRGDLDYTKEGKPFFKTLDANISISHSILGVAVAITDSKSSRVGIDIETFHDRAPDIQAVNRLVFRFFTLDEGQLYASGTPFSEIWTKKEALFKYLDDNDVPFPLIDVTRTRKYKVKFTTIQEFEQFLTVCTARGEKVEIITV